MLLTLVNQIIFSVVVSGCRASPHAQYTAVPASGPAHIPAPLFVPLALSPCTAHPIPKGTLTPLSVLISLPLQIDLKAPDECERACQPWCSLSLYGTLLVPHTLQTTLSSAECSVVLREIPISAAYDQCWQKSLQLGDRVLISIGLKLWPKLPALWWHTFCAEFICFEVFMMGHLTPSSSFWTSTAPTACTDASKYSL